MKVLVTGKGGQLAWELEQTAPESFELVSLNSTELDITSPQQILDAVSLYAPDLIINAAAYTAVDKAETDSKAYEVNHKGSECLAHVCKKENIRMVHVSTDFVFDGSKTTPYQPDDNPNPINVYGDSKLKGEQAIAKFLGDQATIIRTAWVYSAHGSNFVKTMLRLMKEKETLGVVYDQIGTPTWARGLAELIWAMVVNNATGIYHWTDAGVASWYDFAVAIQELGLEKGLLEKGIPVRPIAASNYPTPAKRPSFSVIDKTQAEQISGVQTIHWREQLSKMMDQLL